MPIAINPDDGLGKKIIVWGNGAHIRHSLRKIFSQPVILWIELGDKPKWLPLNFGYHDVMRTTPLIKIFTVAVDMSVEKRGSGGNIKREFVDS